MKQEAYMAALEKIVGVKCEALGKSTIFSERVVKLGEREFSVLPKGIGFLQPNSKSNPSNMSQAFIKYPVLIDISGPYPDGRYLARLNSFGDCEKVFVGKEDLVPR